MRRDEDTSCPGIRCELPLKVCENVLLLQGRERPLSELGVLILDLMPLNAGRPMDGKFDTDTGGARWLEGHCGGAARDQVEHYVHGPLVFVVAAHFGGSAAMQDHLRVVHGPIPR